MPTIKSIIIFLNRSHYDFVGIFSLTTYGRLPYSGTVITEKLVCLAKTVCTKTWIPIYAELVGFFSLCTGLAHQQYCGIFLATDYIVFSDDENTNLLNRSCNDIVRGFSLTT